MSNPVAFAFKSYKPSDKLAILRALDQANNNQAVSEIMTAHNLSTEEIYHWRINYEKQGIRGLRVKDRGRR